MTRVRFAELTPLKQVQLRQHVTRKMVPRLTASECVVVDYIFDRTIMWGRYKTRIPITEFYHDTPPNGPLPLSRNTIISALTSLQAQGAVIGAGNAHSGKSYSINFSWPEAANEGAEADSE